jgi:AcrR family transcriptional regulator
MSHVERRPAPEPPWWSEPRREQTRSTLTREAIVTAALRVLDESGLDGLSMRRVADELDTGAASLYWHIADKDQLIDLMLDRIMGEIELPEPDPEQWEEQIRAFARQARQMFRRHGDVAIATLGRVPLGPNLVGIMEWSLAVLRGAGIPDRPASWFLDLMALIGAAQSVEDHIATTADTAWIEDMGAYLAALPADRFPNIAGAGPELVSGDADARFEFGLDLLIRGLASYLED